MILGKIFRDIKEKSEDISTLYSERKECDKLRDLKLLDFLEKDKKTPNFPESQSKNAMSNKTESKNTFKVVVP